MKKLSIHAFMLLAILFSPIFVQAEVRNVTVHGTVHQGTYEKQILDSVNEERRKVGMPELQMDQRLTEAARQRAIEIGTYYDSRHLRTNLGSASSVMDDFGIFYYSFGENIAAGYSNVSTVMNAWINSQSHYNNIVNSRYSAIGIGVYQSIDGRWFWVQDFSNALNNVYTPDTTRAIVGDYSVRYEDTIRSSYSATTLSDVTLNVGDSHTIDFHVTTFNEVTNSNIPLYLSDWESSNPEVCDIQTINKKAVILAKSAGKSTIHSTFGGVDYSFVVTVSKQSEEVVGNAMIKVVTNYNSSATLLDVDSTKDLTTLTFFVDSVSHNSITRYFGDGTIANPSALDIAYCEDKECNQPIRPVRYQSKNGEVANYIDGTFIFQNSGHTTITAIFENGIQVNIPIEVSNYSFDSLEYSMFAQSTKKVQLVSDSELKSRFHSLNPDIADIDEYGVISAKKSGVAIIQAIRSDGTFATTKVVVYDKPNLSINVDRENVELKENESLTLHVSSNLSGAKFTYDGFDSNIISWNNGTITGRRAGSTALKITAIYQVADGLFVTEEKFITIVVSKKIIDVTDIFVDTLEFEFFEGEDRVIGARVSPSDATDSTLTFESSDTSVVIVDRNGKAFAVAAGEAVITVTASNGVSKKIKVTVLAPERKGIQVDKTHIKLNVGDTDRIQVKNYVGDLVWKSDDESVVLVKDDGTIIAVGKGTTKIHVMDQEEEIIIIVEVTEEIPITEIQVSQKDISLVEGESTIIDVVILPENTTDKSDLVWISSNSNVVSVDKTGKVIALSPGEADITIISVNGVKVVVHVTVTKKLIPISDIEVEKENITLNEGESTTINAKVYPFDTTDDVRLHYQSSNERVIRVDENGVITAIADGYAEITITTTNGISKTIFITVKKKVIPIEDIVVNQDSLSMTVGDVSRILASVIPENTTNNKILSWSSSNTNVVTVDQNGVVRAIGIGNAIITIRADNGLYTTVSVVVSKKDISNDFHVDFDKNPFPVENENGKVVVQLNKKENSSSLLISDNEELLGSYEIIYLEGSDSTFKNPKYNVSIPFLISMDKYASIYVVSILNGEIHEVFVSNIHDGKIHFSTDHFGEYAVIGVLKNKGEISPVPSKTPSSTTDTVASDNPKTGSPIVVYIILWIIAFLILIKMTNLLFQKNRKNDH